MRRLAEVSELLDATVRLQREAARYRNELGPVESVRLIRLLERLAVILAEQRGGDAES